MNIQSVAEEEIIASSVNTSGKVAWQLVGKQLQTRKRNRLKVQIVRHHDKKRGLQNRGTRLLLLYS